MESMEGTLTDEVSGSIIIKGMSSLSEGEGRTGMVEERAEDHSGGLGTVTLLK